MLNVNFEVLVRNLIGIIKNRDLCTKHIFLFSITHHASGESGEGLFNIKSLSGQTSLLEGLHGTILCSLSQYIRPKDKYAETIYAGFFFFFFFLAMGFGEGYIEKGRG